MTEREEERATPPAAGAPNAAPTPRWGLVAVAASAGGLAALTALLGALPADFPVPIVIVQHRGIGAPETLPRILARATGLRVKLAEEGEQLRAGTVYVAPADRHLVTHADGSLHLEDGRRIRFVLSSANPLFESAARAFHERLIAVVLTGSGRDGTDGVQAVRAGGGMVIAQEPATAAYGGMARAAIETGAVDHVLPLLAIAPLLVRLCAATFAGREPPRDEAR